MKFFSRFALFLILLQTVGSGTFGQATSTSLTQTDATTSRAVYRVSPDGKGTYPTIEAALAAATDPEVDKIIELAPGTYQYPMTVNTRLRLTVPRTHLKGAGPNATRIIASSGKGTNSWGVLEVRAPNCSVDGIWVENRWKKGDIPNKQTALAVGSGEDPTDEPDALTTLTGINISNSKFTATTSDRHSDNLAWDVVTVGANVTDCLFENCEMRGFADVFSTWAQNVRVNNCTIFAKGWNALWVSCGAQSRNFPQVGISTFSGCRLGSSHYYVAGGATKGAPGMPVVYLDGCTSANPDGSIPEAARMLGSTALAVVIGGGTPFQPFGSISGGPKGIPATVITSDILPVSQLMLGATNTAISGVQRFTRQVPPYELAGNQISSQTFPCDGVAPGNTVQVTPSSDPDSTGMITWTGYVSAPGQVEVRLQAGPEGASSAAGFPINIVVTSF